MEKRTKNINLPVTIISTALALILGLIVYMYPDGTKSVADSVLNWMLFNLDVIFLVGVLGALLFVLYIAFSKYGNIRLGGEEPEFSKLKIFNMLFCASFGASALYWCFTEVMYYYNAPPFSIEAGTVKAFEYGLAYNFFHWGPSAWVTEVICTLPILYTFYIKGNKNFNFSTICSTMYGKELPSAATKVLDALFIFSCFGVVSISLGLSVPMISECVATALGIKTSFLMNVIMLLVISVVFTLSSYVGLGKGMSKISDANVYLFVLFLVVVCIVSGVVYTFESTINSLGIMFTEYPRMSLTTDPINKGGFPQYWTVFYWAYWLMFGPGMGVFIARLSKGHRIKDIILLVMGAGPIGCFLMHGIVQNYVGKLNFSGAIPAADMVNNGQGNQMIVEVLKTLPFPSVQIWIYVVIAILFMATTLDGFSFTLASATTKKLSENDNPSPLFRLYWCLVLAILPLLLTLIKVDLNTLKTIALLVATPLGIFMGILNVKTIRNLVRDFGHLSSAEIGKVHKIEN